MGNIIGNAIGAGINSSHIRKIQNYLDNATQESVLAAFHDWYAFEIRTFGLNKLRHLYTVYFVLGRPDHGGNWNIQCFRWLLFDRLRDEIATEACLPVLWRCFYFYAWYPFQRHHDDGLLDRAAFERAACSLAHMSDSHIAEDRNGCLIHDNRDEALYTRWRMFRSLSVSLPNGFFGVMDAEKEEMCQTLACEMTDVHDILVKGEPNSICLVPFKGEEVMPVVSRLASPPAEPCDLGIPREDLLAILQLFLRVKPGVRWHDRHNRSTFVRDELVKWRIEGPDDPVVHSIIGEKREFVDWPTFRKLLKKMVRPEEVDIYGRD